MRALIVTNDRKATASRVSSCLKPILSRCDELENVDLALRAANKRTYAIAVMVVPAKWENLPQELESIRRIGIPILLVVEEAIDLDEHEGVALGVVETVPETVSDELLCERVGRFVHRNLDFYQPYARASHTSNGTPGWVPMDDESTCWFCLEQGKASIEHGDFESAENWLTLALRVEPEHPDAQRLREAIRSLI